MSDLNANRLFNADAESGVIAGLINTTKDGVRDDIFELLEETDFYSGWHKGVFGVCRDLWAAGKTIDFVTVSDKIDDPSKLNSALRYNTLNPIAHANIVKELSTRRKVAAAGNELTALAVNRALPIDDIMGSASSLIFTATEGSDAKQGLVSASNIAGGIMGEMQRRMATGRAHVDIETGYRSFDDMMGGFHPAHLTVLAARPAMGKTALMLNFLNRSCIKKKTPTMVFSMEMDRDELAWRLMPIISRVDNEVFKSGQLDAAQLSALEYAAGVLAKAPLFIDDTAQKFGNMIVAIRNAVRRYGIKQVFIDYLQLIYPTRPGGKQTTRDQEITEMTRGLKNIAKECKINVCLLSQLNRSLESREDKRPLLSDLRESGGIEQDADEVLMLYRPVVYMPEEDEHEAQLLVRKHRNGSCGIVPLYWDGPRFLFEDITNRTMSVPTI